MNKTIETCGKYSFDDDIDDLLAELEAECGNVELIEDGPSIE